MSFVKNGSLLRCEATRTEKFELMQSEQGEFQSQTHARLLKVSRSGYHKWAYTQQQRLSGRDDRAAFYDYVDRKIYQIWKDSDEVYGAPQDLPSATTLRLNVRL